MLGQAKAQCHIKRIVSSENVRCMYIPKESVLDEHLKLVEPTLAAYILQVTHSMLDEDESKGPVSEEEWVEYGQSFHTISYSVS